jgi:hypothetical protein
VLPPLATTITFPTVIDTEIDATTLNWSENTWTKAEGGDDKKYWSAPEIPEHFFYWQHAQGCYFSKGDTLKRMTGGWNLYIVSKEQDSREREANKQAKQAKAEAEGKSGKGKGKGKGGKGKGKGKGS